MSGGWAIINLHAPEIVRYSWQWWVYASVMLVFLGAFAAIITLNWRGFMSNLFGRD